MQMKFNGRAAAVVAAAMLLAPVGPASAQMAMTTVEVDLVFEGPDDVFVFDVEKARGAGDVTIDTRDCCLPGDEWRVDLFTDEPANAASDGFGIGNGLTSSFSGATFAAPYVRGQVEVSYAGGVNVFPAGMTVRFQYSKAPGIVITPLFDALAATSLAASMSEPATSANTFPAE